MSRRHGVGREKFRYVEALRRCYQCGFNLGDTTPRLPDWPDCYSLELLLAYKELLPISRLARNHGSRASSLMVPGSNQFDMSALLLRGLGKLLPALGVS